MIEPRIQDELITRGVIIFTSSFHDKLYIVSMGMNARFKVDSHFFNAITFIHCSIKNNLSAKTYLVNYQRSMNLGKLSGSHRLRKA